jgi:hypothetical protein
LQLLEIDWLSRNSPDFAEMASKHLAEKKQQLFHVYFNGTITGV